MPLTDTAIRNAKPKESTIKLSDGGGLQLWITPAGAKLWRLAYRFDGKQRKLSIGPYPAVDLRTARAKREEAKALLRAGKDPASEKKREKLTGKISRENTFEVIAAELEDLKRRSGLTENTISKFTWHVGLAKPDLGKRPISEITAAEVLAVCRKVEARGRYETAGRLKSIIGQVVRYAIASDRASNDPTVALRGALTAPTVKSRAALTEPKQFAMLLRAIDGYDGQPTTRIALQLMALIYPRPIELRMAKWDEFDLDNAVWAIPASRMKMKRDHKVPLARQSVELLRQLKRQTGNGEMAFPSLKSVDRPMSENTMNTALRIMGFSKEQATAHGFRASASTLLNEARIWSSDAVERSLAHEEEDPTRRAYARGKYWQERVEMAQWWADHLDTLRHGAKIIPMSAKEAG